MSKDNKKNRILEDFEKGAQDPNCSKYSSLDGREIEKFTKTFDDIISNKKHVLRIQGGGTSVRDVWDILAQAAKEIESLYENRLHSHTSNTTERPNSNRSNEIREKSTPLSRHQTFCESNQNEGRKFPRTTLDKARTFDNNCSSNRYNTASNGTYYETCPSVREFYESQSGNSGKSKNYIPQSTIDPQKNPCRRNITFGSPIISNRPPQYAQTNTIPNRSATFDTKPLFTSTVKKPESRSVCLENSRNTPLSNMNDSNEIDSQWATRNVSPIGVLEDSHYPNQTYNVNERNKNCKICSQNSMRNQTYDNNFVDESRSNFDDSSRLSTNRTFSNGTFILNKTENENCDDYEENKSFHPHPALASTPKRGTRTPPFRNYTDPSIEYSNSATGHQSDLRTTNSSLPQVIRNETPNRVQRRVNQTFNNPKWISSKQNKSQP